MFSKCGSKMTWFLMRFLAITCVILFVTVPIHSNNYDDLPPNLKVRESYRKRGCNLLYHAILHVHLCKQLTPEELEQYDTVYNYYDWATRMLVVISDSVETRTMVGSMWVFYFYSYKVRNNMRYYKRNKEYYSIELEAIHNETFEVLRNRMAMDCPDLETADGRQRVYRVYINDITKENNPTKLQNYQDTSRKFLDYHNLFHTDTWTRKYNLTTDRLYLNNVIGDSDIMNTLLTRFGLISNHADLKTYFKTNYKTVLDPKTSIKEHIRALYEVQRHFIYMLKVMMLRLCLNHLRHVIEIKKVNPRSKYNLNFYATLDEFTQLLGLTTDDDVKLFSEQFKTQINGDVDTLKYLKQNGMDVEKNIYDSSIAKIDYSDSSMELQISTLKSIAEGSGSSTEKNTSAMRSLSLKKSLSLTKSVSIKKKSGIEESVENSIVHASTFVDYLAQHFSHIDFVVIFFFMNTHSL